jgi:hypothetical protein
MEQKWFKEQLLFATYVGTMLEELNIEWSRKLDFVSLYDYYEDEFDDMEEDDDDFF